MTWGGAQGFQTPTAPDSFIIDGIGAYGTSHQERGLAYYEVVLSGHMVPEYAPWVCDLQSPVDIKLIVVSSRPEFKACSTSWANAMTSRCMHYISMRPIVFIALSICEGQYTLFCDKLFKIGPFIDPFTTDMLKHGWSYGDHFARLS